MRKTILITGSTDGIGLEAARLLLAEGHRVLLHGRNPGKLDRVEAALNASISGGQTERYVADLSRLDDVEALAASVAERHATLDVLINNAGVLKIPATSTPGGIDLRFLVNTIAPYLLTRRLLPRISDGGRVINLSSAAQAPVDLEALVGRRSLDDRAAYAQSKLALTMWSRSMALALGDEGPVIVAVNPGSLLATKMVKDAYGVAGNDIRIGAQILQRAALGEDFADASGRYYDNDRRRFAQPHPDALDPGKSAALVRLLDELLRERTA